MDVIKSHSLMAAVEKSCTAGLPDENLHFGLPDEPTGDKVGGCLREFDILVTHCGMEAVFHLIQEDGPNINMLKEPGKLTRLKVDLWVSDLTTRGVWDPINKTRLPVCPYDEQNLIWSADAFEASCTRRPKGASALNSRTQTSMGPLPCLSTSSKCSDPPRAKWMLWPTPAEP